MLSPHRLENSKRDLDSTIELSKFTRVCKLSPPPYHQAQNWEIRRISDESTLHARYSIWLFYRNPLTEAYDACEISNIEGQVVELRYPIRNTSGKKLFLTKEYMTYPSELEGFYSLSEYLKGELLTLKMRQAMFGFETNLIGVYF